MNAGAHSNEDQVVGEVLASPTKPDLNSSAGRAAFVRILNARLPRKRLISQGLLRNEAGEVLLCQTTYKSAWDLPGGVVDPGESPAACLEREIDEELGLKIPAGPLLAVNWLPPYRGWDDALLTVFDLGVHPREITEQTRLQAREIKAVHWVAPADIPSRVAGYTADFLTQLVAPNAPEPVGLYLENSSGRGSSGE